MECGLRLASEENSAGTLSIAIGTSSGLATLSPPKTCTASPNWCLETIPIPAVSASRLGSECQVPFACAPERPKGKPLRSRHAPRWLGRLAVRESDCAANESCFLTDFSCCTTIRHLTSTTCPLGRRQFAPAFQQPDRKRARGPFSTAESPAIDEKVSRPLF